MNPGDQTLPVPGGKKRTTRKARLVSYSSQEDIQEETSSRRSARKRTAVTKMGGVMIDFIGKNDKEGEKSSQTQTEKQSYLKPRERVGHYWTTNSKYLSLLSDTLVAKARCQ